MMKENRIDRRGFLKILAGGAAIATTPDYLKTNETPPPLTNLPVLHTKKTPVLITPLTRGGYHIDQDYASEIFRPAWIQVSDMPLDFIPPIRLDPFLEVPPEFNPEKKFPWVADVPHVTGLQPTLMKVVVGYSQGFKPYDGINGTLTKRDIVSTHAFTDKVRIYPSKIYNIFTALAYISEWQKEHGPFLPGKEYSYIEMSGVADRKRDRYLIGGVLEAGGICASVSTISKAIYIASFKGIAETSLSHKHAENVQYGENPFEPGITKANSDATASWALGKPEGYYHLGDYRFRVLEGSPPLYLSFSTHLVKDAEPIFPTHKRRHGWQPADARLTFSVTFQENQPDFDAQIFDLIAKRNDYADFHNFGDDFLGGFNGWRGVPFNPEP